MKKLSFNIVLVLGFAAILQSCKKDDKPAPPPEPVTDQSFAQSFDDLAAATQQGWKFINLSDDPGDDGWTVEDGIGNKDPFDGSHNLYANYTASTNVTGNLSVWAISPARIFQNGDKISFYALSRGSIDAFPDRLQLRLNVFNTSDSIGEASTDVGHFTIPLVDINPLYSLDPIKGFPTDWTKFEGTVAGLNKPDSGRVALRYYLELNGGANGDELAVDKFEMISASK